MVKSLLGNGHSSGNLSHKRGSCVERPMSTSGRFIRDGASSWRIFMPHRLDRLSPVADRAEVWKRLATLFEVEVEVDAVPLDPPGVDGNIPFPARCNTTTQLIDIFERAWWDGRIPRQVQWRPSAHPPPADAHKWTRETAWLAFVEMLCACLGLDEDVVTPEATLVGDLDMH